jgi:hypothetical protein
MSTHAVLHGNGKIAEFDGEGILLGNACDARDLILASRGASWIALDESRVAPAFFDLRSGIAGDVLQKFVNYRMKLAILGDISRYTGQSESLEALVRESNRGRDVAFLPTLDALIAIVG